MPLDHTNSVHIAIVGVVAGMLACSDGDNRTVSLTPSSVVTHTPTAQHRRLPFPKPPVRPAGTAGSRLRPERVVGGDNGPVRHVLA